MRKLTYNPEQLNAVANLIWQHNPHMKNHPFIKSVDDVRAFMLEVARDLVCDDHQYSSTMTLGMCVIPMRVSRELDEYEVEFTFDPSVGAEDCPFVTIEVDKIG